MARALGLPDVPWITERGIDFTRMPLDSIFSRAVSTDWEDARGAISVLQAAVNAGRREAAVFLLGLLADLPAGDLVLREEVVGALGRWETKECAAALAAEMRRVGSSNRTRAYLYSIIDVLRRFPPAIKDPVLESLAVGPMFGAKLRARFREAISTYVDPRAWW